MNDCAVLIPSCDNYSDLWRPFFELFWRHWPDCNFNVYLGSNYKTCNHDRVRTIAVGEDISWSDGLISMIGSIKEEYILFLLEDFFFRKQVDDTQITYYLRLLDKLKGGMIRLVPNPGPDIVAKGYPVGIISNKAPYRASTQGSIWNKQVLNALLMSGESAWEFELNGTRRSRMIKYPFYCTTYPVLPYKNHVVERGKWFPEEARRFKKMDIGCDFNARKIMTPLQYAMWNLDHALSKISGKVPGSIKRKIRWFLNEISIRHQA